MSNHLLAIPAGRDVYLSTIRTHMIVLDRHGWWLLIEVSAPGKTNVHIFGLTIAVEFPVAWNWHRAPL